jgi:uncharacterized protein (TIGR03435 family)
MPTGRRSIIFLGYRRTAGSSRRRVELGFGVYRQVPLPAVFTTFRRMARPCDVGNVRPLRRALQSCTSGNKTIREGVSYMQRARLFLIVLSSILLLGPLEEAAPQSPSTQTASSQPLPAATTKETVALPAYDVSAIRAAPDTETGDRHVNTRLNTLDVKNMTPMELLRNVFDVSERRITGLPEWTKHMRLDIDAKTLDTDTARLRNLTGAQRRAMMLALLVDRLGLKWHNEIREMPSYELVVASGGPKLKLTLATGQNSGISVNDTRFRLTNVLVSDLAVVLSDKLERPVVDKTGLSGRYDVVLEWSPDQAGPTSLDASPPLVTVLQEQLGLKLKRSTDPVQIFVIDRLTPPAAN